MAKKLLIIAAKTHTPKLIIGKIQEAHVDALALEYLLMMNLSLDIIMQELEESLMELFGRHQQELHLIHLMLILNGL